MKKALLIAAGVAVAVGGAVVWLQAAAPTIGPASATPNYIVVNTPTSVVITTQITDASLIAGSVNLLRVDSSDKTLATVGAMHDDGMSGDAKSGDKTFSYRLNVTESGVGNVYYRVSAAFKGVLQRSLSNVVAVTVDPFKLPPDPGAAGKETLAGVDSDQDGVRDDVQRLIGSKYPSSETSRAPLLQYARALQELVTGTADLDPDAERDAIRCAAFVFGPKQVRAATGAITDIQLNTPDRFKAYLTTSPRTTTSDIPAGEDSRSFCQ